MTNCLIFAVFICVFFFFIVPKYGQPAVFKSFNTPVPGQTWYVDGVGDCIIDKTCDYPHLDGTFEFRTKIVMYHVKDAPQEIHTVERKYFVANATLIKCNDKKIVR